MPTNMTPSLEAIPLDIKVLILKQITDSQSLLSLLLSSRQYYNTFSQFKQQIKFELLLKNLGWNTGLMREARILAEAQMLSDADASVEEMREFVSENYRSPDTFIGEGQQLLNHSSFNFEREDNPRKDVERRLSNEMTGSCKLRKLVRRGQGICDILLRNHTAVTSISQIFTSQGHPMRYSKGTEDFEIPPTPSEMNRILLAFYRVWVLFVIGKERRRGRSSSSTTSMPSPSAPSSPRLYFNNYSMVGDNIFVRILQVQAPWEVRETISAELWLLRKLLPYSKAAKKYQALEDPMFMHSDPIGLSFNDEFSYTLLKSLHFSTIARLTSLSPGSPEARLILEPVARYFVPGYNLSHLRLLAEPLSCSSSGDDGGATRPFILSDPAEKDVWGSLRTGKKIFSLWGDFWDDWRMEAAAKADGQFDSGQVERPSKT